MTMRLDSGWHGLPPRRLAGVLVQGAMAAMMAWGMSGAWAQEAGADMVLSNHVVTPDPVPANGIATITLTVQNNGAGSASGVTLTDTIPPGATFVGMSASDGGTCSTAVPYACTWASIPFPGSRTVTLQVRLPSAGVWPNEAAVTATSSDPNMGNNSLRRNITVQQAADLAITATSSAAGTIAAGQPYTYTLDVTNHGPDPLPADQASTVTFDVPTGSSITSRPSGPGWTCQPASDYPLTAAAGGPPGTEITCTRSDGLAVGEDFPPITVNAVGNVTGSVAATFDVASSYLDGDDSNNTTTVAQPLSAGTDMSIRKTVALAAATAPATGTQATFTLQARQEGGSAPTGVVVTDTLPAGLTYVSHDAPAPWSCTWGTPALTLRCAYPDTYAGGAFTDLPAITLVANVMGIGPIPNTGHVTAEPNDPNGINNTSTATVDNTADLQITKSSSLNPVVTNQPYNWSIVVRNYGPMPVLTGQYITVTETIPANMRITGHSGSGWACYTDSLYTAAAGYPIDGAATLYCRQLRTTNLGFNPSSGTATNTLTLAAVNTTAGPVTNNACLGLSGNGPTEAGDIPDFRRNCHGAGTSGTLPENSADLQIEKTVVGPDPVVVGQPLTYRLVATNLSTTVDATNVHVYDTVNNLLSSAAQQGLVDVTTDTGTCTRSSQGSNALAPANVGSTTIECALGTLAPGGTATIGITIRPNNPEAGNLVRSNTATINSLDVGDPDRTNNSSEVSSVVQPRVDMTVSKTVNPSPVRVGQPMTYTVSARNAGPSEATNVTITDVMPPNTAFISVGTPSNNGACTSVPDAESTGQTLACTWASVPAGGQRTVTFTVRPLEAAENTTITNTVTVATDSTETDLDNNAGSIDAEVIASELDILVQKTDSEDPVVLGGTTRYTVTIRNAGPSYGTNLVMLDTFPNAGNTARFSYQGGLTATVAGAPVTPVCEEPDIGATSGTLTCTFPSIAVGQANEVVVEYDMRAEGIVTTGDYSGTQGNHVTVAVAENETEMANNAVDEDTTTRREAIATDLALTKDIDKEALQPGEQAVYTLTVHNNGPLDSFGAQVIDRLPAGLHFVASADGCVSSADVVSCAVGPLANGASRVFRFTVELESPYTGVSPLVNRAEVDAPGDTNPDNNRAEAPTRVPSREFGATDLALTKSVDQDTLEPGAQATYTLLVRNNGPLGSVGAQVVDPLPAGLHFVAAAAGCVHAAGTVTCDVGELPNGASRSFTITVALADPYDGPTPLVNTARVNAPGDTDPSNDEDSASTRVPSRETGATDLALTKSIDQDTLEPGEQATYTLLVHNNGPLGSVDAQVVDPLPQGLAFVSADNGCAHNAGVVFCEVGELPSGQSRSFTFTVQVSDPYTGATPLVNTARIEAPDDTDPSNDEDTVSTPVKVPATVVTPVPTLGTLGVLLLGIALAGVGLQVRRRRI